MLIGSVLKTWRVISVIFTLLLAVLGIVFLDLWVYSTPTAPERPEISPPTTVSNQLFSGDYYMLATTKGESVTVLTVPPSGVVGAGVSSTPSPDVNPIPRAGLSAAGVTYDDGAYVFPNPTFFGNPLVFPVIKQSGDWLEVLVPARPNGQSGWIRKDDVVLSEHDARVDINLTSRTLEARVGGVVVLQTSVAIGFDDNPTPVGKFFITDVVPQVFDGGPFGPFVLATSGYSEKLEKFDGGLPVIAIHGTNEDDLIGEPVTNGCIRITNEQISFLAGLLPPGTPVVITG